MATKCVTGQAYVFGGQSNDEPWRWGPRRYLVWFFERIASFSEYFPEAEAALFALAHAETEPEIANNATGIWRELFRIFAGTATPFLERLNTLKTRLLAPPEHPADLDVAALEAALRSFDGGTRTLGPKTFAGRLVPNAWHPNTNQEARECFAKTVELVVQLARSGNTQLEEGARGIAYRNLRGLLSRGQLESLETVFTPDHLPTSILPRVLEQIENFLKYDQRRRDGSLGLTAEYVDKVLAWKDRLMPADAHGRLVG